MSHRGANFFQKNKTVQKPIEQPVSKKLASLLAKLLSICVERLCLWLTKKQIGKPKKIAMKTGNKNTRTY